MISWKAVFRQGSRLAGPAAALALAELIDTGRTDMPIGDFGVERFAAQRAAAVSTMSEEFSHDVIRKGETP